MADMKISALTLQSWTAKLLSSWGYLGDDADYVADTLVDANLRAIDSHGVIRLPIYRARIAAGLVDPSAVPDSEVLGAVARINANGAPGQIAARVAVNAIDRLSTEHGVATAVVHSSSHFGAAGYFARDLARRGKVALVVSNSEPIVVPHGGREALLGTNPIAFAAPSSTHPISLDMATSTSAMGRVLVAQATGQEIPPTWGVDKDGHPTTDASAVKALLPAAGPKGYGLAFLAEVLGGVLSGAAVAHDIGNAYTDLTKPQNVGHWMMAIDVARLGPLGEFTSRMDALVDVAHNTAPAPGFDRVMVPGEPEEVTKAARLADGIEIPESTVAELQALGREAHIPFTGASA